MANTSTPRSSIYNGWFYDAVTPAQKLYNRGTLVLTLGASGNADKVTATDAALPQAVTIGGVAYTFPANDGDSGQQLQTDGSGALTWAASGV